ncbi:MAG: serine/threonine protein kinase [Acidobacteria bacterium]|nr:serine/threonine protein kinase [Acidobacteriota bacterium]
MNPLVRDLFHELADLSGTDRERIFSERRIAPELRAEVESLLGFDSAKAKSLTDCVSDAAQGALGSEEARTLSDCGPYRLVRLLGSGGMGAVYLAERTDGEIRQQAAVKLLRSGVDRPAWRDRFLRTRQLLADLNHPSIARLLDAGHTGDGRPYLVMEYVDGVPIDAYAAGLDLRDQLMLFQRVCDGVSHAHRHLIIHRDLKPSNILVDASGQPKLLDFGIAKLLNTDEDATKTVERLLTPYYASPEQLRGSNQTTATDIYSLGAVLYKLLTGRSPHESESGGQTSQAIEVMTGAKDIPPPSRLNPALPGDIDSILRKALRHEPEERYVSVEAFASDVRAFLEWRPVEARSGDAWYRTRKFLRRYWLPVSAGVLAVAALAVGFGVANHQRAIAQRRFNEVRQLSNKLFDIDRQVRQLPGGAKTRQLIVDTSLEYLRRLAADVQGDPDLALDVGTAYMRVGRVQGVPISANLGQIENAEQNLRIAEGLIGSVLAAQPANRTAFLRAAQIAHDRMILAQARRPVTEALPLARRSEEWLEKYLSAGKVDEAEKDQVVIVGMNVANWYVREELAEEAIRLLRRTIDIARATDQPHQAGAAHMVVARALRSTGDLDGALAASQEAVKLLEPPPGDKSVSRVLTYGLALVTQGDVLGEDHAVSLGRSEEAAKYFERGFRIAADLARQDADDSQSRFAVASRGIRLAGVLRHSDPSRALAIYDEALRRSAEIKNNPKARRDEARALAGSTFPLRQLGRSAEARRRLDAAFFRLRELKLYPAEQIAPGSEAGNALRALAEYEAGKGDIRRGIGIYEQLLAQILASKPKPESNLADAKDLSNIYQATARLHRRARQADAASAAEARRLELWEGWDRKLPNNSFVRRQLEAARVP